VLINHHNLQGGDYSAHQFNESLKVSDRKIFHKWNCNTCIPLHKSNSV